VAVCLLHSYANPEHERRCGEIIREMAPAMATTLSCEISREWREYERTNTCVLNSYVLPAARSYLDSLEGSLSAMGMDRVLHVMQSNGGTATFAVGRHAPIRLVESGPVGGVIGASVVGSMIGEANVISLDVGGTTAKTSLLQGGQPRITTEYKIEWRQDSAGYPVLVPTVDIVEIGAGGGSIAWVDGGGALRVGPASAGADPGPASYGRGGDKPTVTDANVLAGRINPRYFLGGEIPLHVGLAEQAMQPIAAAFKLSVEEAAMGVIRVADSSMVNALKLVSVRRGYDPRDFVLVAFGGGGAMHAGALIRELKVKKAIIPANPAVFSAWGMLAADLRQDFVRTSVCPEDQVDPFDLTSLFAKMEAEAMVLMREQSIPQERIAFRRFVDARYAGQEHTVKVPVAGGTIEELDIDESKESFRRLHEQAYGFHLDSPIELVNYHLTALGVVEKPQVTRIEAGGLALGKAEKARRRVNFDELGFHECPVYERDLLPVGKAMGGPLVIEEPASTTVVFPDQRVLRDEHGFLHLEGCAKP
jgi:N-methylhydantoinase A